MRRKKSYDREVVPEISRLISHICPKSSMLTHPRVPWDQTHLLPQECKKMRSEQLALMPDSSYMNVTRSMSPQLQVAKFLPAMIYIYSLKEYQ